jgi:hypothetical protein
MSIQVQGESIPETSGLESEEALDGLRQRLAENQDNYNLNLELASILHHLNSVHPDGGTRVPEAEAAYRYDI